jgi:hypothetical protein
MSSPFGTSLRRDPTDPRGLLERIDAQLSERLGEAVDLACLDLMVKLRRQHGRQLPEEQNEKDRQEFRSLVREFLIYLRAAYWNEISEAERAQVTQAEAAAGSEEVQRLVAAQVTLAKQLPDYWQRFEAFSAAFARDQLAAPPPKPGFFDRLRGR